MTQVLSSLKRSQRRYCEKILSSSGLKGGGFTYLLWEEREVSLLVALLRIREEGTGFICRTTDVWTNWYFCLLFISRLVSTSAEES